MNLKRLEARVMKDEGFRAKAYQDTVGVWTIGYGSTRLIGKAVHPGDEITPGDAKRLLRSDLFASILAAELIFDRFHEMSPVRQEILANMAYNLGLKGLSRFKKMIEAADELDYKEMAREMVDSKWYRQVGSRSQRLVAAMRTGDWVA